MADTLKHFGVLGMKWGVRREHPGTTAIKKYADSILNNPNSTQKEVDGALEAIGVDPKTGKAMRNTKPIYDNDGNDISVKPVKRFGKKKGQSDRDFDKELDAEDKLDADANPTPANIARRKVEDLKVDQAAKKHTVAMLATVGVILAAKYIAMHQLNQAAKAAILRKYGPNLAKMIIEAKGL